MQVRVGGADGREECRGKEEWLQTAEKKNKKNRRKE
jgi:hypothetical protein